MSQSNRKKENATQLELRSFDRSLPMMLLKARETVMKKFIPSLQTHDLSAQQWRTIRALKQQDGLQISEVAKRCHLLLPSISRIIQNLISRQIIERKVVAADQRKSTLHLTQIGHDLFAKIAPLSELRYDDISEQFGEEKLQQLYDLLDDLITQLNESSSD